MTFLAENKAGNLSPSLALSLSEEIFKTKSQPRFESVLLGNLSRDMKSASIWVIRVLFEFYLNLV